jgi:lipopolysaccharide export LptBFGC system permease protein LptF
MRLLDRFLLREMLGPLGAALLAFVVLITGHILYTVVDAVAGKGLQLDSIARFAALKAPQAMVLALPVSTLLACALALNRMAAEGELTPLFAAGVSGLRLALAPALLGLMATGASFCIQEYAVPAADQEAEEQFRAMVLRQKALAFEPGRVVDTGGPWVFVAREVDRGTGALSGLQVLLKRPQQLPVILRAGRAEFRDRRLCALDVHYYEFAFPDRLNYGASPEFILDLGQVAVGQSNGEMLRNRPLRDLVAARAAAAAGGRGAVREYDMEIHGRLSLVLACFVFALLAPAVALRLGRHQSLAGVLATLVMAFVYYVVMLGLRLLGGNGALPVPVAAWAQDVVLLVVALGALRRV